MSFLCDNLRFQTIIFEYKLRHLMVRVRYVKEKEILILGSEQNFSRNEILKLFGANVEL